MQEVHLWAQNQRQQLQRHWTVLWKGHKDERSRSPLLDSSLLVSLSLPSFNSVSPSWLCSPVLWITPPIVCSRASTAFCALVSCHKNQSQQGLWPNFKFSGNFTSYFSRVGVRLWCRHQNKGEHPSSKKASQKSEVSVEFWESGRTFASKLERSRHSDKQHKVCTLQKRHRSCSSGFRKVSELTPHTGGVPRKRRKSHFGKANVKEANAK